MCAAVVLRQLLNYKPQELRAYIEEREQMQVHTLRNFNHFEWKILFRKGGVNDLLLLANSGSLFLGMYASISI